MVYFQFGISNTIGPSGFGGLYFSLCNCISVTSVGICNCSILFLVGISLIVYVLSPSGEASYFSTILLYGGIYNTWVKLLNRIEVHGQAQLGLKGIVHLRHF